MGVGTCRRRDRGFGWRVPHRALKTGRAAGALIHVNFRASAPAPIAVLGFAKKRETGAIMRGSLRTAAVAAAAISLYAII
jgi:hypothetical protein